MADNENKRTALVTGASSGIGAAITRRLLMDDWIVYGIGRHFGERYAGAPQSESGEGSHRQRSGDTICHVTDSSGQATCRQAAFHPVVLDLLDENALLTFLKRLTKESRESLSLVVNNAGCAYYGLHEEQNPDMIRQIIRTDLEVPVVICQQLIRTIRQNKGTIINMASVTAVMSSPHGAAYGAAKAGLLSFGRSLFDENRKYGVKITTLLPDLTVTNLYRHADFEADPSAGASLLPEDVADAVEWILAQREGVTVPELMLRPQLHRIHRKSTDRR